MKSREELLSEIRKKLNALFANPSLAKLMGHDKAFSLKAAEQIYTHHQLQRFLESLISLENMTNGSSFKAKKPDHRPSDDSAEGLIL